MLLTGDPLTQGGGNPSTGIEEIRSSIDYSTPTPKSTLAELDASNIKITCTQAPRPVPQPGSAEEKSQKIGSDHGHLDQRARLDQTWNQTLRPARDYTYR
jgi:hypothetical protein